MFYSPGDDDVAIPVKETQNIALVELLLRRRTRMTPTKHNSPINRRRRHRLQQPILDQNLICMQAMLNLDL